MRRFNDNNWHFGPFTLGKYRGWKPIKVVLSSGDDEYPGCCINFSAFGYALIVELPNIVKSHREWKSTAHCPWSTDPNSGYWQETEREYGFSFSEGGFFQLFYGQQPIDGENRQMRSYFLPWLQWRFIRYSVYDLEGKHWFTVHGRIDSLNEIVVSCPTRKFEVADFDGEPTIATTRIEELEWRLGEGWFKWLSWVARPLIKRSLDIEFYDPIGTDKSSWKGGLVGTSIEMLPGELHESAFRRFCRLEHSAKRETYRLTFLGEVADKLATQECVV